MRFVVVAAQKKKAYTWTELLFSELKTIQLKMLKSKDSSLLDQGNILYGQINRVRLHLKIANLGYVLGIVLSFTTSNTFIFSLEFCFLWFLLSWCCFRNMPLYSFMPAIWCYKSRFMNFVYLNRILSILKCLLCWIITTRPPQLS